MRLRVRQAAALAALAELIVHEPRATLRHAAAATGDVDGDAAWLTAMLALQQHGSVVARVWRSLGVWRRCVVTGLGRRASAFLTATR